MLTETVKILHKSLSLAQFFINSEMNCEDILHVDYEEMNFENSDPTCLKLQNSDTYFLIFQQELIKSILMLRLQNQSNNIHIE